MSQQAGTGKGRHKQGDSPALRELQVILQDREVYLEAVDVQSQSNDIG